MPSKPVQTNKIKLDPIFTIPAGAEDLFVYSRDNADLSDDIFDAINDDLTFADDSLDDSVTDADSTDLGVPDSFYIESQTARRTAGGNLVIDVVLAIDDVPGAEDYEVQLVKL